jgi:lysophospholipase L1-like esterase
MMKNREDLLDSKRLLFKLLRDYSEGKLGKHKTFYRARVEAVGTRVGELELVPPSPIGAIKAAVYTNALDASFSSDLTNVYYPLIPGSLPLVGEHVLVMFEDVERFSSGFWISKLPHANYGAGPNVANPDIVESQSRPADSSDAFEGTTPASNQPSAETIELRYRGVESNTKAQEQTIANFEGQDSSIFAGKKILAIGDSQIEGNSKNVTNLRRFLQDKGVASFSSFGRRSWGTTHWRSGRFEGSERSTAQRQGEKFDDLVRRESPDVLLIFLGGNDTARGRRAQDDIAWIWEKATQFARKAFWVGPPVGFDPDTGVRMARRDQVSDLISETIGAANFIDSRTVTSSNPPGSRDRYGVHLTNAGNQISKGWMTYVINQAEARNVNTR